jgi:hypothetical protein
VFAITTAQVHRYFRSSFKRDREEIIADMYLLEIPASEDDTAERIELHECIEVILSKLNATERRIAIGIASGLDTNAIMAESGIRSRSTFFRKLQRLKEKLRKLVRRLCVATVVVVGGALP